MAFNFKDIHIGTFIQKRMEECDVDMTRASKFLDTTEENILLMYEQKSLDSELLLRWSKLLEYDFFRLYSQHLILYAPQDKKNRKGEQESGMPVFRKNIYTQEVIDYLVELVKSGKKTPPDLQKLYNIPATTIYRWIDKYGKK